MASPREQAREAARKRLPHASGPIGDIADAASGVWEPLYHEALLQAHESDEKWIPLIEEAIRELDAEHYPDPELKGRGGCIICWPKDGSWPCHSRMIADDLRKALDG